MRAMLLAAGFGTRMLPLTRSVPKPAMPLFGRPLVEHTLRWLASHGVTDVVINLHHCAERMRAAAVACVPPGVRLHFVAEPEIRGTGGGLVGARHLLGDGPVVVVNGDVYTDLDLSAVVAAHQSHGALATLALNGAPENAALFSVGVDTDGRILDFWGQPAGHTPVARYAFTGVHVTEPAIVDLLPPEGFACVKERGWLPGLEAGKRLQGVLTTGDWFDMGTPASYLEAHRRLAPQLGALSGLPGVAPGVYSASALPSGVHGPVCVGPGCTIGEGAHLGPNAFVGADVVVAPGARVTNTVVWDGAAVSGEVDGAVLAPGLSLRAP